MTPALTPRVAPWGFWASRVRCSLRVAGPTAAVVDTVAHAVGRSHLRVKVATDRQSMRVKDWDAIVMNVLNVLAPTEFFETASLSIAVAGEGPAGVTLEVTVPSNGSPRFRGQVSRALSTAVGDLEARGMVVQVEPWQDSPRPSRRS